MFLVSKNIIQVEYMGKIKNRVLIFMILLMELLCFCPMIMKGVILNDELIQRYHRKKGFLDMLIYNVRNELRMGRITRIFAAINSSFDFFSKNMVINNIIQIVLLMASIGAFGYFLYILFDDKKVAMFTMIIISFYMPITFEHASPNAFVGLVTMPIIYLMLSMIFWIKYIDSYEKKLIIISMIFWLFSINSYEYMVTYAPLFILIFWGKKYREPHLFKLTIKHCVYPVFWGLLFIFITFFSQRFFSNIYEGVSVGYVSLDSSFNIIKTLCLSAVPGYFLFNKKYQYLLYEYTGRKYLDLFNYINNCGNNKNITGQLVSFVCDNSLNLRILLIEFIGFVLCYSVLKKSSDDNKKNSALKVYTLLSIGIYIFLPIIPNSIASVYQGNVSSDFFTSLPISINVFFTICLFVSFLFVFFISKIGSNIILIISIIAMLTLGMLVQTMNGIIAGKHENNYDRLMNIESLFETDCFKNISDNNIYAPDFYETNDLLAAPISYWNDYISIYGCKSIFVDQNADFRIYYINDEYFCVVGPDEIAVMSPQCIKDSIILKTDDDDFFVVKPTEYIIDGDFYCYRYTMDEKDGITDGGKAFDELCFEIGNTMESAKIIEGVYGDGWVAPHAEMKLFSSGGHIVIKGTYIGSLEQEMPVLKISTDNNSVDYEIRNNEFLIEIDTTPNKVIDLVFDFDKVIENTGGDIRELSFILNDIYSE